MISHYKLKIILWYTSLLSAILIAVFFSLYTILGCQLRQEIDRNIEEKIRRIDKLLRDSINPSEQCCRFLDYIVQKRHCSFYDIRELTDVVDDKYILIVFRGNELVYLSPKYKPETREGYKPIKEAIRKLDVNEKKNATYMHIGNVPFSMYALHKGGYDVYIGHELSTIIAVQKKILQIFLIVFPFGILFSFLCGYFVTQRSLKVINNIARTAESISSKNLSQRIKTTGGKDEISRLIITLNTMIDRLDRSFTMVKQFSHDAAHEIRTPLTIIQGEIEELLNNDLDKETVSVQLGNILEEIQYLSSIADKLLLIHTLDTGEIEYHFTTVHLDKIVKDVFSDAQILCSSKGLHIDLEKCVPVRINGNEELLIRLLWNLIDNAVKYTPAGGRITISLEKDSSGISIRVKDTGIGIPE